MTSTIHNGIYGREFDIYVTDKNGTRKFYIHNTLNSIYCIVDVEPDAQNEVVLEFKGYHALPIGWMPPSVSGIFFDPYAPRRSKYEYTDANHPKKVTKTIDAYDNESTTQYNADGTVAQSTDFRGKTTKYTYTDDSYARITCVEDPLGNKTWTNYDSEGRVVSTVDARGTGPDDEDHMTKNEYDDDGSLISVTDPLGNKTTYQYDSEGNMVSQTDPTGWITYYNTDDDSGTTEVKDALGRVISSTDSDGNTTYYEYDTDSHLIKITNPDGAVSTNTYDTTSQLTASSDFEGNITRYQYDAMGRTTKTTDPNGDETSYQYDVKGRITKTTYPDETYTETTYDIHGNTKTTTDRNGNITENFYDRLNRVIKVKDPEGNYTYYDYDENGNRTAVRDPRSSGPDDDTYKISYTYDDNDRLTRTDYPDGTYETIAYDEVGNVTSRTDRKRQTTTNTYDNANRLTQVTYHDSSYIKYFYDAAGRITSREDPDGSTVYFLSEGSVGRELRLDSSENILYDYYTKYDSETGENIFMDATDATTAKYNLVKYDENRNIIGYSSTATLGENFKYGADGGNNKKYRQGSSGDMIKFGEIKFGTGGIQYASSSGVLISKRSFNEDTGESTFTDPYGNVFRYGTTEKGSATYYPNNTFTERTFDEYGRLESITHKRKETDGEKDRYGTETILQSFAYQYDTNGNITKITEANGEYTDYTYDNLSRLTKEERKTASQETIYKIEYKFDNNQAKNGNIHQVTVNDTDTTTFTYNEMNELTGITHPDSSTETLTYDNNGNLTQTTKNGETTTYTWNCHDRLTEVTLPNGEIVEFEYDSDGMLIGEKSSGTERKFTQQNRYAAKEQIKNRNGAWEMTAHHTINNQMLATRVNSTSTKAGAKTQITKNSKTVFYHTDHLGSVRLITDENGNTIDTISTDAYGNPLPQADSSGNKGAKMLSEFNFVGTHGIRYVEKIKLHNMRARWYNMKLRRFESIDPLMNILNRYLYSSLNPQSHIDPTGMSDIDIKPFKLSPNTKANKSKLCRLLKKIKHICPSILDNPRCENIVIGDPTFSALNLVSGAIYVYTYPDSYYSSIDELPKIDKIYFKENSWYSSSETELAYALMEELVHALQHKYLLNLTCPKRVGNRTDCLTWFYTERVFKKNSPMGNTGRSFVEGAKIIFETWAQYARLMAIKLNDSTNIEKNVWLSSIKMLHSYRYYDPYFENKKAAQGWDDYYQMLWNQIKNQDIYWRLKELIRTSFINADDPKNNAPLRQYRWYCERR